MTVWVVGPTLGFWAVVETSGEKNFENDNGLSRGRKPETRPWIPSRGKVTIIVILNLYNTLLLCWVGYIRLPVHHKRVGSRRV
jgi:antibiotic biosynthesis monooxygenase (ABM) superfamily enzyme